MLSRRVRGEIPWLPGRKGIARSIRTSRLFSAVCQGPVSAAVGLATLDCRASQVRPWLARSYRRHELTPQRVCCGVSVEAKTRIQCFSADQRPKQNAVRLYEIVEGLIS